MPDDRPSFDEMARQLEARRIAAMQADAKPPIAGGSLASPQTVFQCAVWLNGASARQLARMFGIKQPTIVQKIDSQLGRDIRLARPRLAGKVPLISDAQLSWLYDEYTSRRATLASTDPIQLSFQLRQLLDNYDK